MIEEGKIDPFVRRFSLKIIEDAGIPARNHYGEAKAIFDWVLGNIPFRRDIAGRETLQSARSSIRFWEKGIPHADCDDYTILLGSMFESVGLPIRLVTTQVTPGSWSHIYLDVNVGGKWIAADASNNDGYFGWESQKYAKKKVHAMNHPATLSDHEPNVQLFGDANPLQTAPNRAKQANAIRDLRKNGQILEQRLRKVGLLK